MIYLLPIHLQLAFLITHELPHLKGIMYLVKEIAMKQTK